MKGIFRGDLPVHGSSSRKAERDRKIEDDDKQVLAQKEQSLKQKNHSKIEGDYSHGQEE